jgi:hypothetical protein
VHGEPTPGTESISGPVTVGVAMTGSINSWNANSSAILSYAWSWLRCPTAALTAQCKKAKSGTQTTAADVQYTATPADDTLYMAFQVVAKNSVGSSQPDTFVEASPVGGEPIVGLTSPEITGTTTVGQTLTADLHQPGWSPTPTSYKVVWSRTLNAKTTTIATSTVKQGAANPTYKLVAADDKAVIQISVTASNTAGSSIPANATTSSAVNGEPTGGSASITGSTAPNKMLTATASGFSNSPTKYQYQWLRCAGDGTGCVIFKTVTVGTPTTTYTTVAADNGHKLEVRITAFNAAGASDFVQSALFGPIGII